MLRKKLKKDFSLSLWECCDFDPVTYMIDYPWTVKMIASLMKGHWANFGILSVDVPEPTTKLEMWNYSILENNNKFGHDKASKWCEEAKKDIMPFSMFYYYLIQCWIFLSFSHPVHISPETNFIWKLKIMPMPFIFSCDSITSEKNEEERIWWFSERRTMCNFVW